MRVAVLRCARLPRFVTWEIPEVIQAHGLSGAVDLLVRVVCRDAHDLFRIDRDILAIDGVERTETSLAMGELIPFRLRPLLDRRK